MANTEVAQDGSGQLIVAEVAFESQLLVGFNGIGAAVLQLVGAQFVHQAYATALLQLIHDQAAPGCGNLRQSDLQLRPAVAAQAVEYVAGEALGMDAHERRRIDGDIAHDERDGFFEIRAAVGEAGPPFESEDAEWAILGGEVGLGSLA